MSSRHFSNTTILYDSMRMRNNVKSPNVVIYIIFMLVLYMYIYSPALQSFSFGLDKIVFVIAFFYLIKSRQLSKLLMTFRAEWITLFLILIVSFLVTIFHRGVQFDGIFMYDVFLFVEVLLVPYALYYFFVNKNGIRSDKLIIDNAIIASVITLVLLANPSWADLMKNQILRVPDVLVKNFSFRGFGFSDGLVFGYPVVQGFCASFIIAGLIRNNPSYFYLALLPISVSVFVNARSGLIPIFIAVGLAISGSSMAKKIKIFILGVFLLLLGSYVLTRLSDSQLAESVEWGLSAFEIIRDILSGKEAENTNALFHDMVQFPNNFSDWLIGSGYNLFQDNINGYNQSDIGFCIRSVYGGIVYILLWVKLWVIMYKRIRKINRQCAFILFGSLIYLNWKSDFFVVNPSCRFFFLVYVLCILDAQFLVNKKLV